MIMMIEWICMNEFSWKGFEEIRFWILIFVARFLFILLIEWFGLCTIVRFSLLTVVTFIFSLIVTFISYLRLFTCRKSFISFVITIYIFTTITFLKSIFIFCLFHNFSFIN